MSGDNCSSDLPEREYPPLRLTGERTLPDIPDENYWFQRHLAAYKFLLPFARGKKVVDLGCGEGYGADLLATVASSVSGVDLAPEAIYHARRKYKRKNLDFLYMDIYSLQLEDNSYDLAVSMQVIEHLHDPDRFMEETTRVLKPDGLCVITTPNRELLSPGSDKPVNPFHIFEFTCDQFQSYLSRFFPRVELWGLFHRGKLYWHEKLAAHDRYNLRFRLPKWLERTVYSRWFIPSITTSDFVLRKRNLPEAVDFMGFGFMEGDKSPMPPT